jgi:hypothetical protein
VALPEMAQDKGATSTVFPQVVEIPFFVTVTL